MGSTNEQNSQEHPEVKNIEDLRMCKCENNYATKLSDIYAYDLNKFKLTLVKVIPLKI